MVKGLAVRRHNSEKKKSRVIFIIKNVWKAPSILENPRRVGVWVSTHCRPCSCRACRSAEGLKHSDKKRILSNG